MIGAITRTNRTAFGRWWWTVDHWLLGAIMALIVVGALLTLAASPSVAERLGYDSFHFVRRQLGLLPIAAAIILGVSLLTPRQIRRLATVIFLGSIAAMVLTLMIGAEIKGARRWINLPGFSLQPSEFMKPAFAVVAAWLFAEQRLRPGFPGDRIVFGLFATATALLLAQPDLGMTTVLAAMWFAEAFIAGLPLLWVGALMVLGAGGLVGAYFSFSHVASRIDRFLDPSAGDSYQVMRGLEAFANGGLFGRGPGEGTIKMVLPDAHSDFIFAVAGEEFGLIACTLLVALFAFVVLRAIGRLLQDNNLFVLLAGTGLVVQFGTQAIINMASSLHLIPTKGMTLPFLSYGGSSLLALALATGMLLGLTRRRVQAGDEG